MPTAQPTDTVLRLRSALRLIRRRSLQIRLALLYAAVFCGCMGAVGVAAIIFKPNFLARTGSQSDVAVAGTPGSPGSPGKGCPYVVTAAHQCGSGSRNWTGGMILVAIVVVLAFAVSWLIAGRVLRPLRAIISSARVMSASSLSQRLGRGGAGDEFAELGDTLDSLFARLEASFEAQRHFVANASHELRTPLTAQRTLLQVALADPRASEQTLHAACEQVLSLNDQQERLIDGLLTLASSERGVAEWESFDLAQLAGRVLDTRRDEAGRRGLQVEAALTAAPATGDPRLAESLVANLIDNALRHNVADGRVEIGTAMADGRATISVRNTGTVIAPGEVESLSRPFQRSGTERVRRDDGLGLGLAIVYAIARAHDAALAVRARPDGGLDVRVGFP
jgi:signal transduction histidine kinase